MRAYVITDFGASPELADIALPEPAEGEVRVRVHAASVNGFDAAVANSYLKGMMEHRFPVVLGKDFAGVVDAVAPVSPTTTWAIVCSVWSPRPTWATGRSPSTSPSR